MEQVNKINDLRISKSRLNVKIFFKKFYPFSFNKRLFNNHLDNKTKNKHQWTQHPAKIVYLKMLHEFLFGWFEFKFSYD